MSDLKININPEHLDGKLQEAIELITKNYIIKNFADHPLPLGDLLKYLETEIIKYALIVSEDSQKKAAHILGLNTTTLCEKMKKFGITKTERNKNKALEKSLKEISTFFMGDE